MSQKNLPLTLFLSVGLAYTSAAQTDAGLVAYWTLDSANGTTPDQVDDFDLELSQMDSSDLTTGEFGQAFDFNGEDQFLSVIVEDESSPLPIHNQGSYSVTFWVNGPSQGSDRSRVFSEGSTNEGNPLFNISSDERGVKPGIVDVFIRPGPTHMRSAQVAFDNTWHHVAWVDDHGQARLYVDGELDANNFDYNWQKKNLNNTAVGAILRSEPSNFFDGQIDDVALWKKPLTSGQVQKLANGTMPPDIEPSAPEILEDPQDVTSISGQSVSFEVAAVGQAPLAFQWMKDGEAIPGANEKTLMLSDVTEEDAGEYSVEVSNEVGATEGEAATLKIKTLEKTDAGLLVHWPLDEVIDGSTPDTMNDFNLNLNQMDSENVVEGEINNALQFNGSDEYLWTSPELEGGIPIYTHGNGVYSISMWVKGPGGQQGSRILSEGSTENDTPLFTIGTDNAGESDVLELFLGNNPQGPLNRAPQPLSNVQSQGVVFDGDWHHIAWVDISGEARLYIDGDLDETDFRYEHGRIDLDTTAIGAILRSEAGAFFEGAIDEVSLWNQPLTSDQVESLATGTDASDLAPSGPEIVQKPDEAEELTRGRVELEVTASGTRPLSYQWFKDGHPISGATDPKLRLSAVMPEDAGEYTVEVSNSEGSVTTSPIEVKVNDRPVTPSEFAIDINARGNESPEVTQEGFESFAIRGEEAGVAGEGTGIVTTPSSRTIKGVKVTLSRKGPGGYDDRLREGPTNTGQLTQAKLLRDFVFPNTQTEGEGLNVLLEFLKPNQFYEVTIWAFEPNTIPLKFSNWLANGELIKEQYVTQEPTTNQANRFSFTAQADSQGKLRIQGLQGEAEAGSFGVRLNALRLEETVAPLRIAQFNLEAPQAEVNIATQFPEREHQVEWAESLKEPEWTPIESDFNTMGPNELETQFELPQGEKLFFRVVNFPPEPVLSTGFEEGATGWSQGGANSNWELGSPTTGPGEAHGGENVWATGLDESYPLNADAWLRSPEIDLSDVNQARLRFWEWRHTDPPAAGTLFHHVTVNIKDADNPDGEPIKQLLKEGGEKRRWEIRSFVLGDAVLGKRVIVEFRLHSDDFIQDPLPGWYIDDFAIIPE